MLLLGFFSISTFPYHVLLPSTQLKVKVKSESEVAQSCPTLCNPMDCSPPGSSIHVILQAGILKWVAISPSRGSSRPRDRTQVSRIAGRRFLTSEPPGKPLHPTQAFTNPRVLLILIPLKGMCPSALTLPKVLSILQGSDQGSVSP